MLNSREPMLHAEMLEPTSQIEPKSTEFARVLLATGTQRFGARALPLRLGLNLKRAPWFVPSCDRLAV